MPRPPVIAAIRLQSLILRRGNRTLRVGDSMSTLAVNDRTHRLSP
jgi:hypothetical protein